MTKEQLGGGRQSSYDDAIEAARMNDETRLNGIFSLKSTAVSNKSSEANLASDPFTAPTVKKQKGPVDIAVGRSHRGQTALHVAALSGSFESVKVLLDLNYEVGEQSIDTIAKSMETNPFCCCHRICMVVLHCTLQQWRGTWTL